MMHGVSFVMLSNKSRDRGAFSLIQATNQALICQCAHFMEEIYTRRLYHIVDVQRSAALSCMEEKLYVQVQSLAENGPDLKL